MSSLYMLIILRCWGFPDFCIRHSIYSSIEDFVLTALVFGFFFLLEGLFKHKRRRWKAYTFEGLFKHECRRWKIILYSCMCMSEVSAILCYEGLNVSIEKIVVWELSVKVFDDTIFNCFSLIIRNYFWIRGNLGFWVYCTSSIFLVVTL